MTLISAPPGFGKSTLLGNWTHQSDGNIAWVSLDESDNNPARFLTYLITAISRSVGAETGIGKKSLALLQSPQSPQAVDVVASLINELSTFSKNITLVLDDYHLIQDPLIDESLAFLLNHQPENFYLIIATRDDPQLPLARLQAKSQLNELRAIDLCFSLAETAKFLNQAMGLALPAEDITILETRKDGSQALQSAASSSHSVHGVVLQSDQGAQFQSTTYHLLTSRLGIVPSMSRKGNCLDNAPTESFFSHLKEEVLRHIRIRDFEEAVHVVDDYFHFYNYARIQLNTKLTPFEFRCQFV